MGKKQHQKDKLYITTKEWKEEWGGKKEDVGLRAKFRRLPFNYCCLSLQPFEHPLCTKDGIVFELMNIVPYLKKYGKSPATGDPLLVKELVKLHFHKNTEDKYHCPVTYKIFTENSHIVAIKTSGNVYSYEAVEKLNFKPKNFKDLLTDVDFSRKEVITIQDPTNLDKFNIANFHHIKNNLKVTNEDEERAKKDPMYTIRKANKETESTLIELEKTYKEPEWMKPKGGVTAKSTDRNAAHYSTGAVAGSFTSTARAPQTNQEAAAIDHDVIRYSKVTKKGYVRIQTNHGDLNVELHCDHVAKTCENFIKLCKKGYYDGIKFHRLIRNFMIQGGDPTGTGHGGESAWGKPFEDQFKGNLIHQGRGILSMANSGKNTNGSQFFITFRSCRHLDNKHSVFGHVVGGIDTLSAMESVATDDKDKPNEPIVITKAIVFVDPFEEADEQLRIEEEKDLETQKLQEQQSSLPKPKQIQEKPKIYRSGIGKYIPSAASKRTANEIEMPLSSKIKKKAKPAGTFGNFSSW